MDILKNFPTLQGLVKASTSETGREYRGAMDRLMRPPFVDSTPKSLKLWSLKEQQEFYKNNPMYVMNLPITSDTTEYEVKINADCLCDFCQECYTEDEMHYVADVAICESCFEHYN